MSARATYTPATPAWDRRCGPVIYLTVKSGPKAGATLAYCTCEWSRTYGTRRGAERMGRDHLRVANAEATS